MSLRSLVGDVRHGGVPGDAAGPVVVLSGNAVAAETSKVSALESDGLWFIAAGALLVAVAVLLGGHVGGLSGRPLGSQGTRKDRIVYAGTAAGAALVAVGSVIVAIEAFPRLWIVDVTVLGAVSATWFFAAWRLRVDSRRGRDDASGGIRDYPDLAANPRFRVAAEWDIRRYERQLKWSWCLANAFRSDRDAFEDAESRFGKRPGS